MNTSPYTLRQALIIAESFKFLKGRAFDKDHAGATPILDVLVTPFGQEEQEAFMDDYPRIGKAALHRFESRAKDFEVIVAARYTEDPEIYLWMDIYQYAQRNLEAALRKHMSDVALLPLGKELAA